MPRPAPKPAAGRPLDPEVTQAILGAVLRLVAAEGFARMSVEAVAREAGVGKTAVYRRFADKAELVAAAFASVLQPVEPPDRGDTKAEMRELFLAIVPPDPEGFIGLVGGLLAEHRRHPEMVEAFRRSVVLPRREAALRVIRRGRERGDLRTDVDEQLLLDLIAGPGIARTFAGHPIDDAWRERMIAFWWSVAEARPDQRPVA
jgi:AcrR family transcriptional regulator